MLDLSESRAHGCALQILRAYKLTGIFHVNCEIVLKDLAVFDKVTYEPESHISCLSLRLPTCCVLA
jgi:hypothetical protein